MATEDTKGSGRALTFVVTSALLVGPAVGAGCGSAEPDYVNAPAPVQSTNTPPEGREAEEPADPVEPEPEPEPEPTEPTNVPPPESDAPAPEAADAPEPEASGRPPRPRDPPRTHRTNNTPSSRNGMGVLEGL
jgi:hypothetical protein